MENKVKYSQRIANHVAYSVLKKIQVDDYPYGHSTCTMYYSIEFDKKKGFRIVRQSINPKTGLLNAPKKSTYSHIMFLAYNPENKHVESQNMHLSGFEDVKEAIDILKMHGDKIGYTREMAKYILEYMFLSLKANSYYCRHFSSTGDTNGNLDKVLGATIKSIVGAINRVDKHDKNEVFVMDWSTLVFEQSQLDLDEQMRKDYEATKPESPYRSTGPISLMDMMSGKAPNQATAL